MLSRVADSLYWMSRYLERAEHTARLTDVYLNHVLEQSLTAGQQRQRLVGRHRPRLDVAPDLADVEPCVLEVLQVPVEFDDGRRDSQEPGDDAIVRSIVTLAGDLGPNPLSRWMGLIADRVVGKDFDSGLMWLKSLAEQH